MKKNSPLLSISSVRDDYSMNDTARKAVLLTPPGQDTTAKTLKSGEHRGPLCHFFVI
jgi:hypothetical protein